MWNRLLKLCLIGYTGCVFYAYTMEEGSDLQKETKELISNKGAELLPGVLPLPLILEKEKKNDSITYIPRLNLPSQLPLKNKKLVRISSKTDIRLISPRSPKGNPNTLGRSSGNQKSFETFLASKEETIDGFIVTAVCAGLPGHALLAYRMDWKDHRLSQLIRDDEKDIIEKANIMERALQGMNEVQRRNAIYACLVASSVYGENKMLQISIRHWGEIEGERVEKVSVRPGVLSCLFSIICDKGLDFPKNYVSSAQFLVEHAGIDLESIKKNKCNKEFLPFIKGYVEPACREEGDNVMAEFRVLKRRKSISLLKNTLGKTVIRKRSKSFEASHQELCFLQLKNRK